MTDTNASHSSGDTSIFICPLCQSPLTIADKTWQCDGSHIANNPKQTQHSFDVARQGYVNLLPVQQKKSKDPGDSQASIDARHSRRVSEVASARTRARSACSAWARA